MSKNMFLSIKSIATSVLFVIGISFSLASIASDDMSDLPEYEKKNGISGSFSSIGSDTLANLMTLWTQEFKSIYPKVNIQIQAAGSATAPPALTENISALGPMSRKMKSKELAEFEDKFGYKPLAIPVAMDALSVYVNKDNPISGLTIPQVDAIFSSTRKCGHKTDISTWQDAGLTGEWSSQNIQLFGRNSISGTYSYFKKKALCKGDYKKELTEQPGSAAIVESIAASINSIGYSGIGYKTAGVRFVPLSKKAGEPYQMPTSKSIESGKYPLSRFLYIYINKKTNVPLPALEKEFIKLILSRQGQKSVLKDGYIPLPASLVKKTLQAIE